MSDNATQNLIEYISAHSKSVLADAYEVISNNPGWDLMDAVDYVDSNLYNEWSENYV